MAVTRRNLGQRNSHKRPFQHFGIGNVPVVHIEHLIIKEHNVDINGTGREFIRGAHPAQIIFNPANDLSLKCFRCLIRFNQGGGIKKMGVVAGGPQR